MNPKEGHASQPSLFPGQNENVTAANDLDDPDYFIRLGRMDWWVSKSWNRLHAVADGTWTDTHLDDLARDGIAAGPVRLACGRTAAMVTIPGAGSRLCLPRCKGCCRVLGYEQGTGSPRNDDRVRPLLGLPPS